MSFEKEENYLVFDIEHIKVTLLRDSTTLKGNEVCLRENKELFVKPGK